MFFAYSRNTQIKRRDKIGVKGECLERVKKAGQVTEEGEKRTSSSSPFHSDTECTQTHAINPALLSRAKTYPF